MTRTAVRTYINTAGGSSIISHIATTGDEVLVEANIKITVFWDVTPCYFVHRFKP
jgi:hypothetical protein